MNTKLTLEDLNEMLGPHLSNSNLAITEFSFEPTDAQNSETGIICVEYSSDTDLPKKFFYKRYGVSGDFLLDSEITYYQVDYDTLEDAPIPKCYFATVEQGTCHLLLEDLSHTHKSNKDVKPTANHAHEVGAGLGKLHAHRWGDAQDCEIQFEKYIAHVRKGLERFLEKADFLSGEDKEIIFNIFSTHPNAIKKRLQERSGLTLIHGDANPTNVLSPSNEKGKTYIIDRQPFKWSLRNFIGVFDLAYMMVPFWDSDDRRLYEQDALNSYHRSLSLLGVNDYDMGSCITDYKLCVPFGIYTAVDWANDNEDFENMRWLWTQQIQRSLQAFKDHDCQALIEEFNQKKKGPQIAKKNRP